MPTGVLSQGIEGLGIMCSMALIRGASVFTATGLASSSESLYFLSREQSNTRFIQWL